MWNARRPGPVFNCYRQRELRFSPKITAQKALKNGSGGKNHFLHHSTSCKLAHELIQQDNQ